MKYWAILLLWGTPWVRPDSGNEASAQENAGPLGRSSQCHSISALPLKADGLALPAPNARASTSINGLVWCRH